MLARDRRHRIRHRDPRRRVGLACTRGSRRFGGPPRPPSWGPPADISGPSVDEVGGVMRLTPPSFSASNRTAPRPSWRGATSKASRRSPSHGRGHRRMGRDKATLTCTTRESLAGRTARLLAAITSSGPLEIGTGAPGFDAAVTGWGVHHLTSVIAPPPCVPSVPDASAGPSRRAGWLGVGTFQNISPGLCLAFVGRCPLPGPEGTGDDPRVSERSTLPLPRPG